MSAAIAAIFHKVFPQEINIYNFFFIYKTYGFLVAMVAFLTFFDFFIYYSLVNDAIFLFFSPPPCENMAAEIRHHRHQTKYHDKAGIIKEND